MIIRKFTKKLLFLFGFLMLVASQAGAQNCTATVNWTLNPPPLNGEYEAGQIVSICGTITNFTDQGAGGAWLHGITLQFPPAWDMSNVISTTSPSVCGFSTGFWAFYPSIFSSATQQSWGPGFYFETAAGNGIQDNNPGNNWGNFCTGGTWTFCITIQLDPECGGPGNPFDNVSILPQIYISGDGITGGWGNGSTTGTAQCLNSPNFTQVPNIGVSLNCCDAEAGVSPGTVNICNNGPFDMYSLLGAPVQNDGFWTLPNGTTTANNTYIFDPLTGLPGDYVYSVTGTDGCIRTSTITMQNINLGTLTNIVYCGTAPTTLQAQLALTPWPNPAWNGTWVDAAGNTLPASNGPIDPNTSPVGPYVYSFLDANNCPTVITVNVSFAAGSGGGAQSAAINVCTLDPPFNPLDSLGGTPQIVPGAAWYYTNLSSGFLFFWANQAQPMINPANYNNAPPNTPMVSGYLVYTAGTPPCPPQQDSLYVTIHPATNAGEFTTLSLCVTDPPVLLESLLDGTPTLGMNWVDLNDPAATFPGNIINPANYPPNTTLLLQYFGGLGGSPCFSTSILELTILPADAFAGAPNAITVCATDAPFCMTDFMAGAQLGGVWTNPSGVVVPGCGFNPATMPSGNYTYTITSSCDADSEVLSVTVNATSNPGTNGTLTICNNATNVPLISGLGGTPQLGGTWTPGNLPANTTVNGASVVNGAVYTYTVGSGTCIASATVTIDLQTAPFAGTATTAPQVYCTSDPAFSLFTLLTTPPSATTGTWTGPGGFTGVTLNPATAQSGTYTYTLTSANCGADTESITITIESAPSAGTSTTINACPNAVTNINLLTALGGTPGGTWITVPAGGPTNGIFTPGSPAGAYVYETYSTSGTCTNTATVTVQFTTVPNPGTGGAITVCQGTAPFTLLSQMPGGPQVGGTWTGPTGVFFGLAGVIFNPATHASGNYTYSISVAGCPPVTAVLNITVLPNANAGTSQTVTLCENLGNIDLTSYLGGTPGVGTWDNTNPFNITGQGGSTLNFTYTVDNGACTATSNLTVNVEGLPNAGGNGTLEFCSSDPCFNLTTGLVPPFNAGGTWTNAGGTAVPANQCPPTMGTGGVYTYTVTGASCPSATATVGVTIVPAIQTTGLNVACAASQVCYTVSFTISGGTLPYSVNGVTIAGNTFTSACIPTGTNYNFTVSDGGVCGDVVVNGVAPNCNCPATANFSGVNQEICLGGSANLTVNFAGDGPWNLTYEANGTPVTVNNVSTPYTIPVSPTVNTIYTLTAVSDQNCTGSASGSVTVSVQTPPNAGNNVDIDLCAGPGNVNLSVFIPPGADAGGTFTPSGNVPRTSASSGVYTYTVDGGVCPDDQATYTLDITPTLTATASSACNAAQTQYVVTITMGGGTGAGTYTVDGSTVGIVGSTFTSAPIAAGTGYSFVVDDAGPCDPITLTGNSPNCNCPAEAAFSGGNATICLGESTDLSFTLDGAAPWTIVLNDGTNNLPAQTINTGGVITVTPTATTTYSIQSVSDANCVGSAGAGTITVTVDTPPNAGADVTDVRCGGPGNFSLTNLIPGGVPTTGTFFNSANQPVAGGTVPNNATSSGVYTYELNPNSCPADQAAYNLTIYNPITITGLVTNCNLAQTQYTVTFIINGGTGTYSVNGNTIVGSTFTSSQFNALDGYNFEVADTGPCANVTVAGAAPNCECQATGSITGGGAICQGNCANLTFNLVGVPPFTVVYQNSSDPGNPITLNNVTNNQSIQVCPGTTATYTLLSVQDANCNGTVGGNAVTITVNNPVVISNVQQNCSPTGDTYTVTFNVAGGIAPYVITPAGGTFNAGTGVYTSAPISSGLGYNFSVSNVGACGPVSVNGQPFSCPCTTEAGTLQNTPLQACTNESVSVIPGVGPILDGNDVYQFALHNGNISTLGTILLLSNDGTFSFNGTLQPGVTYYISAIAGNGNAQGNVNLNDPCLSVSNGIPVVFNPLPAATFAGNATACAGEPASLVINFAGSGPWSYSYTINGGAPQGPFTSTANSVTLEAMVAGTYVITSVSDILCSSTATNQAVVSNLQVPTATLGGNPLVCENSGNGPQVTFSGSPPYTFSYTVNGAAQAPITTNANPYTIPATESGIYALTSINDVNCAGTAQGLLDVSYLTAPTAQITGGGVICSGETGAFNLALTGTAPWTVYYTVGGVPQPPLTTAQPSFNFLSGSPGNYVVTGVNDQNCPGPGIPGNAQLVVNPLPSGEILTSDNLICIGQDLQLTFAMQGNPPFDVTYTLNGDTLQLNGIPMNYNLNLNPTEPVIAQLIAVTDGSNPQCASDLTNGVFIQVSELPNAPVLQDDTICAGSGPVSIGVAAAPGMNYSWSPTTGLSDANIANPMATLVNTGITPRVFTYILTASNGDCFASDTVNITVDPGPRARFLFNPDPATTEDPTVYFLNKTIATDNTMYFWDFAGLGASVAKDPQFKFPEGRPGNYTVTLTAIDPLTGCSDTYSQVIRVKRELLIYVPNAFTADSDGKNDLWGPVMTNVDPSDYRLQVFDRTGKVVFETTDVREKWNGGHMNGSYYLQPGVYVWKIVGKEIGIRDEFEMSGIVTLLR